jgi:hypothetical protein
MTISLMAENCSFYFLNLKVFPRTLKESGVGWVGKRKTNDSKRKLARNNKPLVVSFEPRDGVGNNAASFRLGRIII